MTEETPTPAVGQIWQDNDKRGYGRRVRIVEIDGTHAVCEEVTRPRRRTRIRLDRFRATANGYRYIGEQQ